MAEEEKSGDGLSGTSAIVELGAGDLRSANLGAKVATKWNFPGSIFVARQIPGEENWEKRRERGIKLFSTRHVVGLGALEGMLLGSVRRL